MDQHFQKPRTQHFEKSNKEEYLKDKNVFVFFLVKVEFSKILNLLRYFTYLDFLNVGTCALWTFLPIRLFI